MAKIKRMNKNDIVRGRIMDDIAKQFGESVLGLYDGKLRVEIVDEETGEIIQFSVAPIIHKELIDEVECDEYLTVDEKITLFNDSLKKNAPQKQKKRKSKVVVEAVKTGEFNFDEQTDKKSKEDVEKEQRDREQENVDALMKELGL